VDDKRLLMPVLAALLAVGGTASGLAAATGSSTGATTSARTPHVDPVLTRRLRATARRWETVTGRPHARFPGLFASPRALRFWRRRARRVLLLAARPPHKPGWLCIHRFEGSWSDRGDPYWGGLQMGHGFMRTYAPRLLLRRGLANRWTALEQMWVAERAHRSGRGYSPWANAARSCGLI
jgi:hypothetical protein